MKSFFVFLLLFPSFVFAKTYSRTQILMGNVPVTMAIRTTNQEKSFLAMEKAFGEVKVIEQQVSQYIPSSAINRIQNKQGWHKIPFHLYSIIEKALIVSKNTDGAFDITYASPNKTASYRDIKLDPKHLRIKLVKPGMSVLVLGLAKGYIVDRMSDILKNEGFSKHLINAGGDIYASGQWKIRIRNPELPQSTVSKNLIVNNKGVSTSGLYERGHHIYDPKTKKPFIATGSVTIIAPNCTLSDSLDNAAFVLGEKAEKILKQHYPGIKIIFLRSKEI